MAFQKKLGGITIRKVEEHDAGWVEEALRHRRLKVQESSSSQGLNYSILTAISIGTNLAYVGVPWSQAINLTLEEARDAAHDTLMLHKDEERAVISRVTVPGQYKWMERNYYCVTPGTIWALFGEKAELHSHVESVETHTREGVGDNKTAAENTARNVERSTGRNTGSGEPVRSQGDEGRRLRSDTKKGRSGKDDGVSRKARPKRGGPRKSR